MRTTRVTALVLAAALLACSRGGKTGAAPSADGGSREACLHPLKELSDEQQKVTVAAATAAAMTRMTEGGKPLVPCPLDDTHPTPKVVVAHCGGTRSVAWSADAPGAASATSYFDVGGKLSAYEESSEAPGDYTCGDGRTARVAVYGSVPTCQPWTEERYCSQSPAPAASP
jgi:hypothetical protein